MAKYIPIALCLAGLFSAVALAGEGEAKAEKNKKNKVEWKRVEEKQELPCTPKVRELVKENGAVRVTKVYQKINETLRGNVEIVTSSRGEVLFILADGFVHTDAGKKEIKEEVMESYLFKIEDGHLLMATIKQ